MLDGRTVKEIIAAVQADFDSPAYTGDEAVFGEVARRLSRLVGLDPMDLATIDLTEDILGQLESHEAQRLIALTFQGSTYSKAFKDLVKNGKVVLIGSGLPPGFHDSLDEYLVSIQPSEALALAEADPEVLFIIGSNVDGEEAEDLEDEGVVALTYQDILDGLIQESQPTLQQVAGMFRAFGGEFQGQVGRIRRGYSVLEIGLHKGSLVIDGKAIASRVYLGGEIVGNPEEGELAIKAMYWSLLYALSASQPGQIKERLKGLTQVFAQEDTGAILKGRALHVYEDTQGILSVKGDNVGRLVVVNGDGECRVKALAAAAAIGLAAFPGHQLDTLAVGNGALAKGAGVDGDMTRVAAQKDKEEKVLNRSALTKPCCGLVEGDMVMSAFLIQLS